MSSTLRRLYFAQSPLCEPEVLFLPMNVLVHPYVSNMVVPWLRQFVVDVLTRRPTFDSGPVRVAFAMNVVALGQVLLRVP